MSRGARPKPEVVMNNNWVDLVTASEEQTPQDFINQLAMESKRRTDLLSREQGRTVKRVPKEDKSPRYTVYVRLPFQRGDFVDPQPVNWDEKKSEALWSIIWDPSRAHEINWGELASHFKVSLEFIIQMANYLAERHTTQLRAQIIKATATTARGVNSQSPVPGSGTEAPSYAITAEGMRRTGSTKGNRPGSALSIRSQTPVASHPKNEGGYGRVSTAGPSTRPSNIPVRPTVSRNSSSGTAVPTLNTISSRPTTAATRLNEQQTHGRRTTFLSTRNQQQQQQHRTTKQGDASPSSPGPASSSSSDNDDSDDGSPVQSRIIRRPPFSSHNRAAPTFDGVDEEPEPAFLPFAAATSTSTSNQDMTSTLRGNHNLRNLVAARGSFAQPSRSQTSDSSSSSAAIIEHQRRPSTNARDGGNRYPSGGYVHGGALSPRRTAELKGKAREAGSDGTGTPSMGSSFSDLDDTSVTDSALEEALASRMQDGTLGSRMSIMGATLGQAIKSRYLPKSNRQ
ncbi:hypothetical protein QBC43DRAFT_318286 [Cladorrhinum sp. PSN259]|nr:hypothetical protein QBC43DRAFT_318286 [Cladorrhinum sp. PSN259]